MTDYFVKTDTILDQILAHKAEENAACKAQKPLKQVEQMMADAPPVRDFAHALHRETVALIAEVKKASPSRGVLVENFDAVAIATTYAQNGASAISVLTDERFFQGNIRYLQAVRRAVDVPVLCKEFVIDSYQVAEARAYGADAVLLIVMALDDAQLADLHAQITSLGMSALVEVHNEAERERALKVGATLIGVNNRDLKTFHEDLTTTERLAKGVPGGVTLVAESAIRSPADVQRMGAAGAHAVLVGEGLVKAPNMAQTVRDFSSQHREAHA
jgi:indole-3-glycerol phosphate synthase